MDRAFRIVAGEAGAPVTRHTRQPRVVVLGGGLAGIAAAVRLHERGAHVTLIETKNRLGGRATSFVDPKTAQPCDNCQHVVLKCCTNLIDLYERLGVIDRIHWHDRMYFATPEGGGTFDVMKASSLPAPAHLAPALMRFTRFSWGEKIAIARGMEAVIAARRERLHDQTFGRWLRAQGQPETVIGPFWDVIITSACNLPVDRVSAEAALQVFQDGFVRHKNAWIMGTPECPLVDLYQMADHFIDDLRLRQRAVSCGVANGRMCSVTLEDGGTVEGDAFVVALPYQSLADVFNPEMRAMDERLSMVEGLKSSPILGVHLHYDRSITNLPHLVNPDGGIQWFFFRDGGRYAHGVVSAADHWMKMDGPTIIEHTENELKHVLPGAASARLISSLAIKEKRATFACEPGSEQFRPSITGRIGNLFLAGDYTQTGWPATMEGAVRSGYMAAAAVMDDEHPQNETVPDLKPGTVYSFVREILRAKP